MSERCSGSIESQNLGPAGADERRVAADALAFQGVDLADRFHRHIAGFADGRALGQVEVDDKDVVQVLGEERRADRAAPPASRPARTTKAIAAVR